MSEFNRIVRKWSRRQDAEELFDRVKFFCPMDRMKFNQLIELLGTEEMRRIVDRKDWTEVTRRMEGLKDNKSSNEKTRKTAVIATTILGGYIVIAVTVTMVMMLLK